MNAKLAVAISLGASSLALFGMANVANAATVTTTDTGANQPVVKPSNENPVEKAKGEAQKAVDDATEQKNKLDEEVNKAENEANDSNAEAINANKEVTEAQTKLDDKKEEVKTAEEEKGKADKELDKKKTAAENADKEVKATQAAFDKETENQKAAENKLKATQEEKGKAEGELNTEKEAVKAKETEHAQAGEKVKTEKGKLDTANTQLEQAKQNKKQAQEQATQLSSEADQKKQAQKEAEQKVKENTQQQENIQKQIDNLNAAGSGTTSAEVQELKNKTERAKQDYDSAQNEANTKVQEATNAHNAIAPKAQELNNAETALNQNEDVKNLKDAKDKVTEAEKEAEKAEKAYNEANTEKLDSEIEQGFDGFLDSLIKKYENDTSEKGKAILEDAKNAKKILNAEDVVIPDKITKVSYGEKITPGYTIKAPMWYKDLVKLKRVGGADSLKNLQDAETYYEPLNEERRKNKLNPLNVNLSMIAESIVNSYYSGAVIEHSANHDDYNSASSMNTHPYLDSSENLAWGSFDKYDSSTRLKREHTRNDSNNVGNAMDGWYDAEKAIYDNAIEKGTWSKGGVTYTLTDNDKNFLKEHRYDFTHQAYRSTAINNDFESAVGHYLNFVDNKINSCGFADSNNSVALKQSGENVVVWHGSKQESQLSVEEFTESLNEYIANLTGTRDSANKLEPSNAENLKSLSAKITEKNKKLFDAKYELRKVQYDLNMTPDGEKQALQDQDIAVLQHQRDEAQKDVDKYSQTGVVWSAPQEVVNQILQRAINKVQNLTAKINSITESKKIADSKNAEIKRLNNAVALTSKNFEEARAKATAANKAKEEAAKKATELKTAWTTANSAYEAAKQKAQAAAQQTSEERQKQINQLTTELNGLKETAKTLKSEAQRAKNDADTARAAADNKQAEVNGRFTQDITEAEANVESTKQAVSTAEAAKKQVDQELKAAKDKVTNLTEKINKLTTQIEAENQKVENAKSEVQATRAALQGAKDTQNTVTAQLEALKTKVTKAGETLTNANDAVKTAKENVVKKIKLAQTAVANAQAKVQHAKEVAEAAKTKIETIKKNLATKQVALAATITDTSAKAHLNSIFMSATGEFESFVQILTGKVSTLQTTATNLTKSATALNDQLQKVAPESVVTPPVVPPAPKPPVVVPSHDGESGHGSTGNTGNTNNTGNTENAGNTGNGNVPFTPQAPHVSVPAVDVEQQSNEFASTTAENHVTHAVAKSEAGKSTKAERANAKNTKHANHTASANAAATSSAGVAQSKNAKDSKNAESKESAKKDSAKQETQDSNSNSSDQNNTTNNTPSNESKNAQANGNAAKAQNSSNNTLTIGAVVAVVIAGIVAIGGGVTFARHRRM